jgi:hypothetical protein
MRRDNSQAMHWDWYWLEEVSAVDAIWLDYAQSHNGNWNAQGLSYLSYE